MGVNQVEMRGQNRLLMGEVAGAIDAILRKSQFFGSAIGDFERAFADYCGVSLGVGCSSGTSALELALRACRIGAGCEVIVPINTFTATAAAVVHAGAKPVFVDVDGTHNLDPGLLEISGRVAAILPVHLYGQPADMDAIINFGAKRGLVVIEDCAQAHGAKYRGCRVGSLGDAGCFSFYPTKNLGAVGDAGVVVTNIRSIADQVAMLKNHGRIGHTTYQVPGYNHRMDAIQAVVLLAKLKYLDGWNEKRRRIAARYRDGLRDMPLELPLEIAGTEHVYYQFVVMAEERDSLREFLGGLGIETGVHYPTPLHMQPAYADLGYRAGQFPVAERACARILSLPMYPSLGMGKVDRVIGAIWKFYGA